MRHAMDGLQWFVLSLVILVLLAACSVFYYKYCHQPYKAFKDAGRSLQVCPNFKPFLGHSWDTARQGTDTYFARIIKKYGKITGLFMGALPTILVADPDLVQNLMITNFNNFTDRPEFLLSTSSAGLPVGIFNDKGDSWRNVRKLASTSFTGKKLKQLAPHVEKSCRVLVEKLKKAASSSEEHELANNDKRAIKGVGVFQYFGRFSIESSVLIIFGRLMDLQNGADPDFEKAVMNVMTTGRKGILSFLFNMPVQLMLKSQFPFLSSAIPFLSPSPLLRDFNTLCSKIQEMVRRRKAERMTSHSSWNSKEADLLDQLINDAESREEDPETIREKRAVCHCFNFLMAGYETTALTLSYTCYLLALHPRVQDKLREEIRQFFASNKEASLVGVQELQYLDMVVQEVMRIYPPSPRLARSCTHATDLGGVRVPDGTSMLVPALLLHTDKKIWGDPDVFRPERFSAEEKAGRPNGCYMPFGLGPRNCIGMRFALMEMKMALSAILLELRFTPAPDTEIPLRTCSYTFVTAPTNGVYLSISHLQQQY